MMAGMIEAAWFLSVICLTTRQSRTGHLFPQFKSVKCVITGPAGRCKSRNSAIGVITLKPWCACTNIPVGGWRSSMVRAALSVLMPKEFRSMSQPLPPREPVRPAVLSLARREAVLKDATRRWDLLAYLTDQLGRAFIETTTGRFGSASSA